MCHPSSPQKEKGGESEGEEEEKDLVVRRAGEEDKKSTGEEKEERRMTLQSFHDTANSLTWCRNRIIKECEAMGTYLSAHLDLNRWYHTTSSIHRHPITFNREFSEAIYKDLCKPEAEAVMTEVRAARSGERA